jgi:hypothetical protein
MQMLYDVVPHDNGWAIVVTPATRDGFATRQDAFDEGVKFARKLRFVGYQVQVRAEHEPADRRFRTSVS